VDRVYRIAEGRAREGLATLLTINAKTIDDIRGALGPAIWGRIAMRAVFVRHCQWPDYRLRRAGQRGPK
jgi:hypothetical protein